MSSTSSSSSTPTPTSPRSTTARQKESYQRNQLLSQISLLQQKQAHRRSAPNMKLPVFPNWSQEDLKSHSSSNSSNVSNEKLKSLSNSPISKRLHVSNLGDSSKYVIPIPFTLQLPPKLSQKNIAKESVKMDEKSAEKTTEGSSPSPKRVKLIYTGTKYEKLENSSEEEGEDSIPEDNSSSYSFKSPCGVTRVPTIPMPPRPSKNPFSAEYIVSQLSANVMSGDSAKSLPRRPGKFFQKLLSPDELSVIEEASNSAASSRKPSMQDPIPPKVSTVLSRDTPIPNQGIVNERNNRTTDEAFRMPRTASKEGALRIHKRSFSDESQASSVSSFSSIGDVLSFTNEDFRLQALERKASQKEDAQKLNPTKPNLNLVRPPQLASRTTSISSNDSESSIESWNSLQKSIDISLGEVESISPKKRSRQIVDKSLPPTPMASIRRSGEEESEWVDEDSETEDETMESAELTITEHPDKPLPLSPSNMEEVIMPLRISRAPSLMEPPKMSNLLSPKAQNTERSFDQSIEIDDYYFTDMESVSTAKYSDVTVSTNSPGQAPLSPSRMAASPVHTSPLRMSPIKPNANKTNIMSQNKSTVNPQQQKRIVSIDNNGTGKRFSFPNNLGNSTNLQAKPMESERPRQGISRFSLLQHGQIEIPDLNDKAVSDRYSASITSYSYSGATFEDLPSESDVQTHDESDDKESSILEPIGVPSSAAKKVFRQSMQKYSNDSDSDESNGYSLYSAPNQAKSTPNLKISPIKKSPVRHSRHKSMHSIDFDLSSTQSSSSSSYDRRQKSRSIGQLSDINKHSQSSPFLEPKLFQFGSHPNRMPQAAHHNSPRKVSPIAEQVSPRKVTPLAAREVSNLPETMNIVVTEPPHQVNYAVDFTEAQSEDEDDAFSSVAPTMDDISLSQQGGFVPPDDARVIQITKEITNLKLHGHQDNAYKQSMSGTSNSSYQSSRSAKPESTSSASDTESVVIDLTKDYYDVCSVSRQDSTTSYKSVIEKDKQGKEVEVVLVEDEDEADLLSLYSKYRNDSWLFRAGSTTSTASTASFASGANTTTERQLLLQPNRILSRYQTSHSLRTPNLRQKKSLGSIASSVLSDTTAVSENYNSQRIKPPPVSRDKVEPPYTSVSNRRHTLSVIGSNFDYSTDNYDFDSFMRQQSQIQ